MNVTNNLLGPNARVVTGEQINYSESGDSTANQSLGNMGHSEQIQNIDQSVSQILNQRQQIEAEMDAAAIPEAEKNVIIQVLEEMKTTAATEVKAVLVDKLKAVLGEGIKKIPTLLTILGGYI